jgi:hypothetical protein
MGLENAGKTVKKWHETKLHQFYDNKKISVLPG